MKLCFILKRIKQLRDQAVKCLSKLYIKGLDHLPIAIGFLMVLFFIPTILIGYLTYGHYQDLKGIEERLVILEKKAKKTFVSRFREAAFMKQAQLANLEFVQKYLALDKLLQNEKIEVNDLLNIEAFKESPFLLERRSKLNGNKAIFKEKLVCEKNNLQEVGYVLKNPIEADIEDVKNLLATVEGEELIKVRPQLFFSPFLFEKKIHYF